MQAPKCRTCGKLHFDRVCPEYMTVMPTASKMEVVRSEPKAAVVRNPRTYDPDLGIPISAKPRVIPEKAPFDRKAYQRAYMVGYRLKQKTPKP